MSNSIIHPPGVSAAQINQMLALMTPMTLDITPVEAQTITMPDTDQEILVNLMAATDLAALSFVLPSNESTRIGQRVFIRSSRVITEMDVSADPGTTVDNWITNFNAGDSLVFIKSADAIWSRVL